MHLLKIILIATGCIAALAVIYIRTDWRYRFAPLFPLAKTDESTLGLRNGIMYAANGAPFTGTAVFKGIVKSYPDIKGAANEHQHGKRVTAYKDGLKDGEETVYFTRRHSGAAISNPLYMLGYLLFSHGTTSTHMHSRTAYAKGLKHGVELINYNDDNEYRRSETTYSNGLREGICKEYYRLNKYYADAKNNGRKIGPLKVEAEYHHGVQSGIYRTYTESGRIENDYITDSNGQIVSGQRKAAFPEMVSGRRKEEFPAELICLEFFEAGQLTAQKIVSPYAAPDGSRETFNEVFYENGSIAEERVYNMRNGKCLIHRKRIDGELVELFNRDE